MKFSAIAATALFATTMLSAPAQADPLSKAAVSRLDRAIDRAIAERRIAGAVVLVAKDGKVVYRRAKGMADVEAKRPMTADTIFRLTSVSKPIVTSAAMRLVEMGILDLDRPVTDWVPDFKPKYNGTTPAITLRQLLTHTSGIGYVSDEGGKGPYNDAGVQDGGFGKGITLEENLRRLASADLRFAPGTAWNYGLGIDVIGRVIEKATNLPLEVAVRDLVTQPLGMKDTGFHVAKWDEARLAANYRDGKGGPALMHDDERVPILQSHARFDPSRATDADSWASAGAGMTGSAEDLMRLLQALADKSDRFLDGTAQDIMMVPQTDAQPYIDLYVDLYAGVPKNGAAWTFGIGGAVLKNPDKANTPQSAGTFTWTGAYGHSWFVDPKEKIIVVSMTNTAWEGIYGKFPHDVRDAVYAAK